MKARQETRSTSRCGRSPSSRRSSVTAKEITIKQQIQFALDSAVILPESFGTPDRDRRHASSATPRSSGVEVQGHTDNSGTAEHNQLLSEQRAEAVRAWLVQHGVDADRLVARGYGQEQPLVPNVTAGNRAQNRRVQFIILEKDGSIASADRPGQPAPPPKKNVLPGF